MSAVRSAHAARHAGAFAIAVALGLSVISCGGNEVEQLAVPLVYDYTINPASDVEPVGTNREIVLPAEGLRAVLEQGLAWHGITLVEVMRGARRDDPNVQTWINELVQNTNELTAAIGLVYGPDAASAFHQQWAQHTQFLVDYAVAVGHGSADVAAQARESLHDYAHDAASFFGTATDGALPAHTVEDLLATHVGHMLSMIDADAAGEVDVSVDLAITDSAYLSTIAQGLATGIVSQHPEAFPGQVDTPNAVFCSVVTTSASSYIVGLLMTDDVSHPLVREAADSVESETGASTAEVIGPNDHLLTGNDASTAGAARDALDHVVEFTGGSSKPTTAPPAG